MTIDKEKLFKSNAFIAFIYLLLLLIFFNKVLFNSNYIVFGTDALDGYAITSYVTDMIWANGQYPLWIPVHFSGMAHIDPVLLPVNFFYILIYILPLAIAYNIFMIIHFFFAGFFTYLYSNYLGISRIGSFISGLIFMFCGVLISHLFVGHIAKIGTWAYIPLLLFLTGKGIDTRKLKYFLVAGIIMGHQFLGYHMQMAYYSTLLVASYALFKIFSERKKKEKTVDWLIRPGGYFATTLIIAVLMYSMQLIPSYLYTHKYSERSGGTTYEFSASWSFAPRELPGIVIRDPFGVAWPNTDKNFKKSPIAEREGEFPEPFVPYWGPMPQRLAGEYFGVLPLLLAFIGIFYRRNRLSWFMTGTAVLTLLLSMGKYTPVYWLAYKLVYGFKYFRVPLSIFAITAFSLSILAGKGFDFLLDEKDKKEKKRFRKIIGVFTGISALSVLLTALLYFSGDSFMTVLQSPMDRYRFSVDSAAYGELVADRLERIKNGMMIFSLFMVISTGGIYLHSLGKLKRQLMVFFIPLIIIIDLWDYGHDFIFYAKINKNAFYGKSESIKYLNKEKEKEIFRALPIDDRSIPKASINLRSFSYHGIQLINGRHDLAPIYYMQMLNATLKNPKLLSLLNTKYVLVTKNNDLRRFVGSGEKFEKQFDLVMTDEFFKLYENKEYMDRVFIVNTARIVSDDKYVLPYMMRNPFDPEKEAVIEEKPEKADGVIGKPAPENRAEIELYSPNRILVSADLKADGFLVLADTYYPDWKVYVDGKEGTIYKTDHALRGVYLNRGSHKVEFVYDSKILKICGTITGLTVILTVSAILWIYYREKKGLSTI